MVEMIVLNLAIIADEQQEPEECIFDCTGTCDTGCIVGHGHWRP